MEKDLLQAQIGMAIKKKRKEENLTQEQLAEKAKLSVDYISLIERGKRSPSLQSLSALAVALNTSIKNFFYDDL